MSGIPSDDFEDISNSEDAWELISSDNQILISVTPWVDGETNIEDLAEATYQVALDLIFEEGAEVDGDCGSINQFDGCFVIGAVNEEDWDYFLVGLLLDTDNETNLQIAIAFNDGDADEVIEILSSFFSYE